MSHTKRWSTVVLYAAAMAWVEAAVVFYLRTMLDRITPYQAQPLPEIGGLGPAELVRELATMVMLLTVGILAGRTWRSRLGYTAIAFGVWDIFYYVFLKVLCRWPNSIFDWDLLFLIPLPWWGPVIAPVSIALLMICWGTLASGWDIKPDPRYSEWKAWCLNFLGILLALYVFMADTLKVAGQGVEALRNVLPREFNWSLFSLALLLMAAPVGQVLLRLLEQARQARVPLDYSFWLTHFRRNQENRPIPNWAGFGSASPTIEPGTLKPLIRSLEQFQLGDGGGPASLIARDAETYRSSTPEVRQIVDAWFAEELGHSRLLGAAVDALGGRRLRSHWSFTAFCQCRRLFGVRFELQVLLLTEITSTAYYRMLHRYSPFSPLTTTCALILRDEGGHISFHCARLAAAGRTTRGLRGWFWTKQFALCGYAAGTMLWINHRKCLVKLGGTTSEFYREVTNEMYRFLEALDNRVKDSRSVATDAPQTGYKAAQPLAEKEHAFS